MKMNNNIKETIVSIEVAKLLKNSGFNILCEKLYHFNGSDCIEMPNKNSENLGISAPTQQLAIDWIRVNFGIHILCLNTQKNQSDWFWEYTINKTPMDKPIFSYQYDTPEEAKDAAIEYTLKNLI